MSIGIIIGAVIVILALTDFSFSSGKNINSSIQRPAINQIQDFQPRQTITGSIPANTAVQQVVKPPRQQNLNSSLSLLALQNQTSLNQQTTMNNTQVPLEKVQIPSKDLETMLMEQEILLSPTLASNQEALSLRRMKEMLMEKEIQLSSSLASAQRAISIATPQVALSDLRKVINQNSIKNLHKSTPDSIVSSGPVSLPRASEPAVLIKTAIAADPSTNIQASFPPKIAGVNDSWSKTPLKFGEALTQEEILVAQQDQVNKTLIKKLANFEAHWQGADLMELDAELKRQLGYPMELTGIIVNEVTFNTQAAGIEGADVIQGLNGIEIKTLQQFKNATKLSQLNTRAKVTVWRKGKIMVFDVVADDGLGMAQTESAPQIMPGEPRPHPHRGACTTCHIIRAVITAEITPDPDDIILQPRAISSATRNPHENRGPCNACHVMK
ncbi:MAG: PDZ domain-containing protein [Candidatus Riflebacteria bacterium]|nr:PDZ domain-containing protein [Candidatus Riflebacteria bacterium]